MEQKPKSLEVVKGPLQVIISIADQKISVYDDGTLLARSSVSTGVQGHSTPVGVFSVIGKELWHRSNIYSAALEQALALYDAYHEKASACDGSTAQPAIDVKSVHAKIGELTLENDS